MTALSAKDKIHWRITMEDGKNGRLEMEDLGSNSSFPTISHPHRGTPAGCFDREPNEIRRMEALRALLYIARI